MADVKWIKLTVDLFDDEKILLISSMPDGNSIIIVWIKLLCLAGKQNNSGVFTLGNVPYTSKMLATIFRMDEATVSNSLNIFQSFGMIHIIDNVIIITNWGRHQNLDKIEAYKTYQREYMRTYRAKQKAIATGEEQDKPKGKTNPKTNISSVDKEADIKQDKKVDSYINVKQNKNTDIKNTHSPDYDFIIQQYNNICKSLPRVVKQTDDRRLAIGAAAKVLDGVTFEQLFEKVEKSDFLKGLVKDWKSDFDWIMQPKNIVKILSGLYDNREPKATVNYTDQSRYENLKMED
jgi:predicted phage replisome organizer